MHVPSDRYQDRIRLILDTIPDPANRATVKDYLDERFVNHKRVGTLLNEANALRDLAVSLAAKPLKKATRQDIMAYAAIRERERIWRNRKKDGSETIRRATVQLSQDTLACRHAIVRQFYKWLLGKNEYYPPVVSWLKPRRTLKDIPTDQLLNADDLRALFQAHPDVQDQALIAALHDTGFRNGELCALNVGSVEFEQHGGVWAAVVTLPKGVPGLKTGARPILVFECVPYLRAWLEAHPRKHEKDAPLFYERANRCPGARYTVNALWRFTQRAKKRAKVWKRLHPHLFRHTAATERARLGWNEAELKAHLGWTLRSKMPATYIHLAGRDFRLMELRRRGLATPEPSQLRALAPRLCMACRAENGVNATNCLKCFAPVSPEAKAVVERRRQEAEERQRADLDTLLARRAQELTAALEARVRSLEASLRAGEAAKGAAPIDAATSRGGVPVPLVTGILVPNNVEVHTASRGEGATPSGPPASHLETPNGARTDGRVTTLAAQMGVS